MSAVPIYTPAPGSVAARVMDHLEKRPYGAELSSSAIATALGIDATRVVPSMVAALEAGLVFRRQKGGHERSPMFWSLIDHGEQRPAFPRAAVASIDIDAVHRRRDSVIDLEPAAPVPKPDAPLEDGEQPHDAEPPTPPKTPHTPEARASQQVLKAEPATADATDRDAPANASPVGGPKGAGQAAAAAPLAQANQAAANVQQVGLRVALWSDGTLQIERERLGELELLLFTQDEARQLVAYLDAISLDSVREEISA